MAEVKLPLTEQIDRGRSHFGLAINQTSLPRSAGDLTQRGTFPIDLKEAWGPFTHFVVLSRVLSLDAKGEKISVVQPSVELSLRIGEGWESGLAARVTYQEFELEEDEIEDGHIDVATAEALRPVSFGLETMVDSNGVQRREYMGHGSAYNGTELSPVGRTVTQILQVGLDTMLDFREHHWAQRLEPES